MSRRNRSDRRDRFDDAEDDDDRRSHKRRRRGERGDERGRRKRSPSPDDRRARRRSSSPSPVRRRWRDRSPGDRRESNRSRQRQRHDSVSMSRSRSRSPGRSRSKRPKSNPKSRVRRFPSPSPRHRNRSPSPSPRHRNRTRSNSVAPGRRGRRSQSMSSSPEPQARRVRHDSSSESESDEEDDKRSALALNGESKLVAHPKNAPQNSISASTSKDASTKTEIDKLALAGFDMGAVYLPPGAEDGISKTKDEKDSTLGDATSGDKKAYDGVETHSKQEKLQIAASMSAFSDFDMGSMLVPPDAMQEENSVKSEAGGGSGSEDPQNSEKHRKTKDVDDKAPSSYSTPKEQVSPERKRNGATSSDSRRRSRSTSRDHRSRTNDRRSTSRDRRSTSHGRRSRSNDRRSASRDRSDDDMRDSDSHSDSDFRRAPTDFVWPDRKDGGDDDDDEFPHLPIHDVEEDVLRLIRDNDMCVITGDTGSGKSTQLAQFLARAGYGQVAVTQPRRVGAVSVAGRVAEEMGVELGREVGYTVRFDDCTCERTRIRFLTDGCLLRECLLHSQLEHYDVIILDEAHERSLQTDILFGLVRDIVRARARKEENGGGRRRRHGELKLVVTSATLDTAKFCKYFDDAPSFHIPGRCFPVQMFHSKTSHRLYVQAAVEACLQIHQNEPADGHILVFLTGQDEIEQACELLGKRVDHLLDDGIEMPDIVILPAYAALPGSEQRKIFLPVPDGCRKVVISTNLAETSLTVDGVAYVVDSGLAKQKNFNPKTGIDSLMVVPISRTAAKQRAGRAGRTREGVCYRLYPKETYDENFLEETIPEIQRTSLPSTVLLLKTLGIEDPLSFEFMDQPSDDALVDALRQLYFLGAILEDGEISGLGRQMAQFPLEPKLSKLLLTAVNHGCIQEMLTITSMLSAEEIFIHFSDSEKQKEASRQHRQFWSSFGDHITMLCAYDMWSEANFSRQWCDRNFFHVRGMQRAKSIREQLEEIMQKIVKDSDVRPSRDPVGSCRRVLAIGFFTNAARLTPTVKSSRTHKYRPLRSTLAGKLGQTFLSMHPSCSLQEKPPQWIIYDHIVYTSQPFMHQICAIEYEWVAPLLPLLKSANVDKLAARKVSSARGAVPEPEPEPVAPAPAPVSDATSSAKHVDKAARAPAKPSRRAKKIKDTSHLDKRATTNTISSARDRYLARQQKKQKKKAKKGLR